MLEIKTHSNTQATGNLSSFIPVESTRFFLILAEHD